MTFTFPKYFHVIVIFIYLFHLTNKDETHLISYSHSSAILTVALNTLSLDLGECYSITKVINILSRQSFALHTSLSYAISFSWRLLSKLQFLFNRIICELLEQIYPNTNNIVQVYKLFKKKEKYNIYYKKTIFTYLILHLQSGSFNTNDKTFIFVKN